MLLHKVQFLIHKLSCLTLSDPPLRFKIAGGCARRTKVKLNKFAYRSCLYHGFKLFQHGFKLFQHYKYNKFIEVCDMCKQVNG